uniref:Uncharacterized protein n=1 Tax=Leviviridae sp. TaxID=2027243 RepID=A0A514DA36_9VIRU|nr:MAG: hypothetical protein H1Rhizo27452_000002 [Leviviridae sp.]
MRSLPNFLAVSRSEGASKGEEGVLPVGRKTVGDTPNSTRIWPRRDDLEFNELNLSVRISYKTLVLAFVLFDVFHKVVNVVFDLNFL